VLELRRVKKPPAISATGGEYNNSQWRFIEVEN
jgi:hypothetical protein